MFGGNTRKGCDNAGRGFRPLSGAVSQRTLGHSGRRGAPVGTSVSPLGRPVRQGPSGPVRRAAEGRGGVSSPVSRGLSCLRWTGTSTALTNSRQAPQPGCAAYC